MSARKVVVTGLGAVSPFGVGVETLWDNLVEGRYAIRPLTRFDTSEYRYKEGGEVPDFEFTAPVEPADGIDRANRYLLTAAAEALADAGLEPDRAGGPGTGVMLGTNFGAGETIERWFKESGSADTERLRDLFFEARLGSAGDRLATWLEALGPRLVLSLSCSSGASAVAVGLDLIRRGAADRVVAGGYDSLSEFAWSGLSILRTMTAGKIRPFDARRDGTIFSEGAGVLLLEEMELARGRGARVYAEVAGAGVNNNAFHMTAPDQWGTGLRRAIEAALADAGVEPGGVDFVMAHGTGTKYNDASETQALKAALGPRAAQVPVVSIKSMIGHTMGASSSLEEVATLLAMTRGVAPGTINCEERDPECDLDYVTEGTRDGLKIGVALANSSGIGGSNAVVVFRKAADR